MGDCPVHYGMSTLDLLDANGILPPAVTTKNLQTLPNVPGGRACPQLSTLAWYLEHPFTEQTWDRRAQASDSRECRGRKRPLSMCTGHQGTGAPGQRKAHLRLLSASFPSGRKLSGIWLKILIKKFQVRLQNHQTFKTVLLGVGGGKKKGKNVGLSLDLDGYNIWPLVFAFCKNSTLLLYFTIFAFKLLL